MVSSIITVRLKQLNRIINDIGLGRFLFIVVVLVLVTAIVIIGMQNREGAYFLGSAWIITLLMLHLKRKDLSFLRSHIDNYRYLLLIEYLVLSLPVIAGLILWLKFIELGFYIILLSTLLIVRSSNRKLTLNTWLQRLIPDDCFEWKSGIRSSLVYLVPLYITGLAGSFWPGTVPVVMLVTGLVVMGFNEKNEPLPMLTIFEKNPRNLLFFKIQRQIILYSLIVMPLVGCFLLFNSEYWYIVAAFYLLNIIVQVYAVLAKYSFYQPHVVTGNQVFQVIGSISIVIPLLLPLVLVLGIRFYFKSVSNLNQYLYDYN